MQPMLREINENSTEINEQFPRILAYLPASLAPTGACRTFALKRLSAWH
ncbi:hypothetical protein ACSFCD_11275 [Enterococcus faecalis]